MLCVQELFAAGPVAQSPESAGDWSSLLYAKLAKLELFMGVPHTSVTVLLPSRGGLQWWPRVGKQPAFYNCASSRVGGRGQ